jgi:hypothetical protein
MAETAAIDGVTGPGRRTILISSDVQEVGFKLKKKVLEVTNRDGSIGHYDLAEAESVQVSINGTDFTLAMTSKQENEDARRKDAAVLADTNAANTTRAVDSTTGKPSAGGKVEGGEIKSTIGDKAAGDRTADSDSGGAVKVVRGVPVKTNP